MNKEKTLKPTRKGQRKEHFFLNPGHLVFCFWFIAGHVFRHLFETAPTHSAHFWVATKSETDCLPRRAGFVVILHGAEFVIFSIRPGSNIGGRNVRRNGRDFDCDGF